MAGATKLNITVFTDFGKRWGEVVKVFIVDFSSHRSRRFCKDSEEEKEEPKKEELTEQTQPDTSPVEKTKKNET